LIVELGQASLIFRHKYLIEAAVMITRVIHALFISAIPAEMKSFVDAYTDTSVGFLSEPDFYRISIFIDFRQTWPACLRMPF